MCLFFPEPVYQNLVLDARIFDIYFCISHLDGWKFLRYRLLKVQKIKFTLSI